MALPPIVPREALFGNPDRIHVRLSPDGSQIAYIAPDEGVLNVWVRSLEGGDDRPVTHDRGRGIREFFWAYDRRHICYLQDKAGDENWLVYAVDLQSGEVRNLTPYENVQAHLVAWEPEFPDEFLVGLNIEEPQLHDLYRVKISTAEKELVAQNPGDIVGWDVDWKYRIRGGAAMTSDGGVDLRLYKADTDEWENLIHAPFGEQVYAIGTTPDEGGFYIMSTLEGDTTALLTLDIATRETRVIAQRPDVDFDGDTIRHPTLHHIQAASFTRARQEWTFLDSAFEADFRKAASLDVGEADVVSRSLDDRMWIMAFSSDINPARYYLYNRETGDSRYLFDSNSKLNPEHMARMEPVEIPTRDGLVMVGYLTLPSGVEGKNLPLVLNVHGGPWARDTWGFRGEPQWLANRGYACLQVNYRGSTGFGKKFVNAANREWGGKMHDDLIDAVNWAVERGIADPARIGIMGWSYGGYATLVGMTFTPDVFAVGLAGVGISNLVSWYNSIPPYWEPFRAQLDKRVGNGKTEEEFLKSRSPLFHIDNIRAPLMVVQGANDPRVPRAESDQIVDALRSRGVDVEYLLFEDEGHGLARPENRLKFYARAEEFLARVLGGRVEA